MFANTLALLRSVKSDKKGVTALEYGVIASAAVVVLLVTFNTFYAALSTLFVGLMAKVPL
jgi:Flp pilus assembly pilin Flp